MKLFKFQPNNPGPLSFFTIAHDVNIAWEIVDKHIKRNYATGAGIPTHEARGWGPDIILITNDDWGEVAERGYGTDYYIASEGVLGDVLENNND